MIYIRILIPQNAETPQNIPPIRLQNNRKSGFTVFRDVKPLWENINKRQVEVLMSKEFIMSLP
jgi:hypothetical protein